MSGIARGACRLRPLEMMDARLLFDWRNQPRIRRAMFTTGALEWAGHFDWVARVISAADSRAFIFEQAGVPAGYVKLDRAATAQVSWGFYIGASEAPPGSGGRMLFLALEHAFETWDAARVEAQIRPENAASLRLHEKLGFVRAEPAGRDGAIRVALARAAWQAARKPLSTSLFIPCGARGG